MKKTNQRRSAAFTLLEILLVVFLIGLLAVLSLPFFNFWKTRQDLNTSAMAVASNLRRAQLLSQLGIGDSAWGLRLNSDKAILFKGDNFASRNPIFDEEYVWPSALVVSGWQEIFFSRATGTPSLTGQTSLIGNNDTRLIIINSRGIVSY